MTLNFAKGKFGAPCSRETILILRGLKLILIKAAKFLRTYVWEHLRTKLHIAHVCVMSDQFLLNKKQLWNVGLLSRTSGKGNGCLTFSWQASF